MRPLSPTDMHPADIRAAVNKKGFSLAALSRAANLPEHACRAALKGRNRKGEMVIAKFLGLPPEKIWPSRFSSPRRRSGRSKSQHSLHIRQQGRNLSYRMTENMIERIKPAERLPPRGSNESIMTRQIEFLARKFLSLAQSENEKFTGKHIEVATTAAAAIGAYALNEASMRIFANMICLLPPERRESYIAHLVSRYEPSLREHVENASCNLTQH